MNPFPSQAYKETFLAALRMAHVAVVTVEFSGSGDSGQIDGVTAVNAKGNAIDLSESKLLWPTEESTFADGQWAKSTREEPRSLEDIAKTITYEALEQSNHDWYNNAGGQGSFQIDFATDPTTITLEVGVNYSRTDDHSYDLNEEEENA